MDAFSPGLTLLLMGMVTAMVVGLGAAIGWAIVSGWRDRDHHRPP